MLVTELSQGAAVNLPPAGNGRWQRPLDCHQNGGLAALAPLSAVKYRGCAVTAVR